MVLQFAFTDKLKSILKKLRKKNPERVGIIYKKVHQIIETDEGTIEHYKNLRHGLSDRKRVHIDSSFVLTFHYDKSRKFILFLDFDHHDNIYER